ncbi:MAG: hypothetical protein FJX74_22100 [Armatimonadetes bacterium]|nr:hypothetical protein [Armatimonadota bacterium]
MPPDEPTRQAGAHAAQPSPPGVAVPADLEFDDRPLPALLAGEERALGTPASPSGHVRQRLRRLRQATAAADWADAAGLAAGLSEDATSLPPGALGELTSALDRLLEACRETPDAPWTTVAGSVFELQWDQAKAADGPLGAWEAGGRLAEWHERQRRFEPARGVIEELLTAARAEADTRREAECLGRRAFTYVAERDWENAAREVWAAAKALGGLGDPAAHAPIYAEHLAARLGGDGSSPAAREEFIDPFLGAQRLLTGMAEAMEAQDWARVPELAAQLMAEGHPLSPAQLKTLREALLPFAPNPSQMARPEQPDLVGRALESAWALVRAGGGDVDIDRTGYQLGRWYGRRRRFAEQRAVLTERLASARNRGARREEAVILNDLGFAYSEEGAWEAAAEPFQQAVEVLETLGEHLERANSRINYLACRLERDEFRNAVDLKPELHELLAVFREKNDWRQCKPLYYLARIEEAEGNLEAAAALLRESLAIDESVRVTYRDREQAALDRLQARLPA